MVFQDKITEINIFLQATREEVAMAPDQLIESATETLSMRIDILEKYEIKIFKRETSKSK